MAASNSERWNLIVLTTGIPVRQTKFLYRPTGFTLVELLVVIGVVAVLAALLSPALSRAKRQGQSMRCRSNLHQLGLGIHLYAEENGGRVCDLEANPGRTPLDPILGLIQRRDLAHCPEDRDHPAGQVWTSYEWNFEVSGRLLHKLNENHDPGEQSRPHLLTDRESWHGYRNALFADGQVEIMKTSAPNPFRQ